MVLEYLQYTEFGEASLLVHGNKITRHAVQHCGCGSFIRLYSLVTHQILVFPIDSLIFHGRGTIIQYPILLHSAERFHFQVIIKTATTNGKRYDRLLLIICE